MQVWNVLHVAHWKCRTQKSPKTHHLGIIAQFCRAISSQLRHISTIGKTFLNSNVSPHVLTICWTAAHRLRSVRWFGAPQQILTGISRLDSVTARHSSSGRQQNFAALNRGRHLYSARRPSRWALAHISSWIFYTAQICPTCHVTHTNNCFPLTGKGKFVPLLDKNYHFACWGAWN